MIIETYICDKCAEPMRDSSYGMYVISHESIGNNSMWGDNRITRDIHFCKSCYEKHLVPILLELKVSK